MSYEIIICFVQGIALAQSVGTYPGNWRVANSSLAWTKLLPVQCYMAPHHTIISAHLYVFVCGCISGLYYFVTQVSK